MMWNWEQENWPDFRYGSPKLDEFEILFWVYGIGASIKNIDSKQQRNKIVAELLSGEALNTSIIEGDNLNADALEDYARSVLGLKNKDHRYIPENEMHIINMLVDVHHTWAKPLSHKQLCHWNYLLTQNDANLLTRGEYRDCEEIIESGPKYSPRYCLEFQAPPPERVHAEMDKFISWFNESAPNGPNPLPPLTRAGIAHLYFVSIHPFEDGNGRIARALVEKALSQALEKPALVALSYAIEKDKKLYMKKLQQNNKNLDITNWLEYFAKTIIAAQVYTEELITFFCEREEFCKQYAVNLNLRQNKVVKRMLREGIDRFDGGMTVLKYLRIAETTKEIAEQDIQDLFLKGVFIIPANRHKQPHYYLHIPCLLKPHRTDILPQASDLSFAVGAGEASISVTRSSNEP